MNSGLFIRENKCYIQVVQAEAIAFKVGVVSEVP